MEKQPRLGYDMADGYWFDRSKPERLSEQPQTYQECDPIAMVVELEAEIDELSLLNRRSCRVNGYEEDRAEMLQEMIQEDHVSIVEIRGKIEYMVNCNDVFAWACADGEPLPLSEVENAYNTDPLHWAILRRGMRPQKPYEDAMRKNGTWHERLDVLPPRKETQ